VFISETLEFWQLPKTGEALFFHEILNHPGITGRLQAIA
jgi:hypothetical protein